MELGLSLGDSSGLKQENISNYNHPPRTNNNTTKNGLNLSIIFSDDVQDHENDHQKSKQNNSDDHHQTLSDEEEDGEEEEEEESHCLLRKPNKPSPHHRQHTEPINEWLLGSSENGSSGNMDFPATVRRSAAEEVSSSRASDEDENNNTNDDINTRKKLRLSKRQSSFLEESFKENHTLNPKQKIELAKQLNLRPRQIEVWFQNRRARTKLKQTEIDCEYLKRCCEALTEENKRLFKELQELKALKTSNNPFCSQLIPATTLTMCPSCTAVTTIASLNPTSFKTVTTTASSNLTSFKTVAVATAATASRDDETIPKAIPLFLSRSRNSQSTTSD